MGVSNGPSQLRATNVIIAKHLVAVLEILCPPASQRSIGSPSLPGNPSQSPLVHLEKNVRYCQNRSSILKHRNNFDIYYLIWNLLYEFTDIKQ